MRRSDYLSTVLLCCALPATAAPVSLCYEDSSVYPWITGTGQGLAILQMQLVAKESGIEFDFVRLPWKRCLLEVEAGRIHAAIAASYNKERAIWGVYPRTPDGKLQRDYRMHTDSFYVYRHADSQIRWQTKGFQNLGSESVGAQLGYSVGKDLEEAGYRIKYHPASSDLLSYLENRVLQVIVLQDHEAKRQLSHRPSLRDIVIREALPVKVADQYLLFGNAFYNANKAQVQMIWQSIEKVRKSKLYLDEEREMLGTGTGDK
jgi:polar amino acid transport system substrate-binding protein